MMSALTATTSRQAAQRQAGLRNDFTQFAVIGELQARTYEAKDGTTRMSLDVQADEVEFLSPKQQEEGSAPVRGGDSAQDMAGFTDIQSDDIPF